MTITVKIDNPDLEKQLIEFVKQQKQDLEEIKEYDFSLEL